MNEAHMTKHSYIAQKFNDASSVAQAFDPARFALARKAAGMKKKDLAEIVGKSPAVVTQYELGQTRPSADMILSCAEALNVEPAFFARGRAQLPLTVGDAHFRSLRRTTLQEREQSLAEVELRWEVYNLLTTWVRFPNFVEDFIEIGKEARGFGRSGRESARYAARTLRESWNQATGPITHLIRNCESRGILVFDLAMEDSSDRIDAFSHWLSDRPVIALARLGENPLRRRSNIAHELAHLILHHEIIPGDVQHEREAQTFASEFLIPRQEIEELLPRRLDIDGYLKLQREWGVSIQMLFYAAREFGVLSESTYKRAMVSITHLGWRKSEPTAHYPTEIPIALASAYKLAGERGLNIDEACRALKLTPSFLRKVLGFEDPRPELRLIKNG
jgi:Zn-dependent peptidase ImmA (M78 family)/transcriptional regulator with XRE-family HTH domain